MGKKNKNDPAYLEKYYKKRKQHYNTVVKVTPKLRDHNKKVKQDYYHNHTKQRNMMGENGFGEWESIQQGVTKLRYKTITGFEKSQERQRQKFATN